MKILDVEAIKRLDTATGDVNDDRFVGSREVPSAIPISDLACVRDTLCSSLDEVTGHPKGKRKQVETSGTMLVTISKGDISPEIGDAFAVWIHDWTA